MSEIAPAERLAGLLACSGWQTANPPTLLHRSGNNRVYRFAVEGRNLLAKEYFFHPDDPRDRFRTEKAFYAYLRDAGVGSVPEQLGWIEGERIGIFEFVEGSKPEAATSELVDEALAFLTAINSFPDKANSLPNASEACFTIREHVERIHSRVLRLGGLTPVSDVDQDASRFVEDELAPRWAHVRETLLCVNLPETDTRCVSPSDFGFHNCLVHPSRRAVFLDFEYAGWDDPAKTVCDFFCQPSVPVPNHHFQRFAEVLGGERIQERSYLLLPAYQIKWCCILLNDFLAADGSRRAFSDPSAAPEQRRIQQLEKARRFILQSFG